jgi:non-ribosomal peptide synthase protein (TIGR01720 family)
MIADYVSAVMLATEFMSTYNNISQEKELKWQTGKDYRKWLYLVEGYCRDVLLPAEIEYWESLPWDKIRILPSDFPDKFHTDDITVDAIRNNKIISSYTEVTHSIDADETSKLFGIFGVEFENILTAVFFLAVAKSKQMEWLNINVCNSGRNILPSDYHVDANKLVGYISTARALLLKRPEGDDLLSDVYDVVDQIKNIPNAGIGFYLIREHIKNSHLRSSYFYFTQQGDIFLNYFGRMDANNNNEQYDVVMEDTGLSDYTMELQNTLLECLVGLRENRLHIKIAYSDVYFRKETIGEIIDGMKAIFQGLVSGQTIDKVA